MHLYLNDSEMQIRLKGKETVLQFQGEGSKRSEKDASAICKGFLFVAQKYPDLLNEALKRLVA